MISKWKKRIGLTVFFIATLVVIYALIYQWALSLYGGADRTFLHSMQVVVEILTTTGFGGDTEVWRNNNVLSLMVILINVTGMFLVFLAIPVFFIPLLRESLDDKIPESSSLTNHVIICSFAPKIDVLCSELDAADIPYVVVEEKEETVLDLNKEGINSIKGDPERVRTFKSVNIGDARAVVVDVSNERNSSVILSAREARSDIEILSVATDERHAEFHRYAGADSVIIPNQAVGKSLGRHAASSLRHGLYEVLDLDGDVELFEIMVDRDSRLDGKTLAESRLREKHGLTVVAVWKKGEFIPSPSPDTKIEIGSILLVMGAPENIEALNTKQETPIKDHDKDEIVVFGYGEVGRQIVNTLKESGFSPVVVDKQDLDGVDIVGDITDLESIPNDVLESAREIIIAIGDDRATINATVALKKIVPDTTIIAGMRETESEKKLYRAGAQYVLAVSMVTGRLLASILIEGEEIISPGTQTEVMRCSAPGLAGKTLGEADIRKNTGATIIGVERDEEVYTNIGEDFMIEEDDVVIVTGDNNAINSFIKMSR